MSYSVLVYKSQEEAAPDNAQVILVISWLEGHDEVPSAMVYLLRYFMLVLEHII